MALGTEQNEMRSTYQILGDLGIEPSTIGLAESKKTIPLTDFEQLFFNTHGFRLRRLGTKKLVYNKRASWFGYKTVDDFCMAKNITGYTKDASQNETAEFKTFFQWSKLRVPYNRATGSYEVIWEDAKVFVDERNFLSLQHQAFNYGDKRRRDVMQRNKAENAEWNSVGRKSLLELGRFCAKMKREYFPDKRDKNTGLLKRSKFKKETFLKSPRVKDTDKRRMLDLWHKSLSARIQYLEPKGELNKSLVKCRELLPKVEEWQNDLKVSKKKSGSK